MDRISDLKKYAEATNSRQINDDYGGSFSLISSGLITLILYCLYYGFRLSFKEAKVDIQIEGEKSRKFVVGDKVKFRVQLPHWNCLHLLSGTWSIKDFNGAVVSREIGKRVLEKGKDYIILKACHIDDKDPTLHFVHLEFIFITPGQFMLVVPTDRRRLNGERTCLCFDVEHGECDHDTTHIADLEPPILCLSNVRKSSSHRGSYENVLNIRTVDAFMNPTKKFDISEFSMEYLSFTSDKKIMSFKFYDDMASKKYTDDQCPVILKFRLDRPGVHRLRVTYQKRPIRNGDFTAIVVDYQELISIPENSGDKVFPAVLHDPRLIDIGRVQLNASFRLCNSSGSLVISRHGDRIFPVAKVELPVDEIKIRLLYFKSESEPYTFLISHVPKTCTCTEDIELRDGMVVVRMAPLYARAMMAYMGAIIYEGSLRKCQSVCEETNICGQSDNDNDLDFNADDEVKISGREHILFKDHANNYYSSKDKILT